MTGTLTVQQLDAELALLGPRPPWWRPFKRRRWYAAKWALFQRLDDWEEGLERIMHAIKHGDHDD